MTLEDLEKQLEETQIKLEETQYMIAANSNKEVLSFNEARMYLGKISKSTLYELCEKKLPYHQPEGLPRTFLKSDLVKYMQTNKHNSLEQLATIAATKYPTNH